MHHLNLLVTLTVLASTQTIQAGDYQAHGDQVPQPVTPDQVGKSTLHFESNHVFFRPTKRRRVENLAVNIEAVKGELFKRDNVADNELAERLEQAVDNLTQP